MHWQMKMGVVGVLLVLAVSLALNAQSSDLNGPIASVETWTYTTEMQFGQAVKVWKSHKATTCDDEGNVIEEIEYSATGDVLTRTVHKYDASSCRIESIQYGSSGEIKTRTLRKCDSSGREVQIDVYNCNGNLTGRSFTEYEGNLERDRSYDADGKLIAALDVEKDSNGNIMRMVLYDKGTGKPDSVIQYELDADGKTLRTLMYNEDSELVGEFRYSYSYGKDGMDEITTTTLYVAGTPFKTTTEGTVIVSDSFGNWTEKRTYKQETRFGKRQWVLAKVEQRIIKYR